MRHTVGLGLIDRDPSQDLKDAVAAAKTTHLVVTRVLGYSKIKYPPHGFRATVRTILDEVLGFRVDYIEQQLAHAVNDANGRAYNRTRHLPERKQMMQTWTDYLDELRKTRKT